MITHKLSGKTHPGILILCAALLSHSLLGCRTPWPGTRASGPNFDDLIEIERRQSNIAGGKQTTAARERNAGESDLAATKNPAARKTLKSTIDLEADDEFFTDYEQASPEEQAMLDQVSQSLLRQPQPQQQKLPVPMNTARNPTSPPSSSRSGAQPSSDQTSPDDSIGMRFTDDENAESVAGPEQHSPPNKDFRPNFTKQDSPSPRREAELQPATHAAPKHEGAAAQLPSYAEPLAENEEDAPQPLKKDPTGDKSDLSSINFRELGYAMIDQLNKAYGTATHPDERVDLAKKRRLLNLVLDDLNSAQEPIKDLQPEAADYIRNTFQGLYDATDIGGNPVASRRLTLALQSHRKAMQNLAKLAILEVQHLAFCTEVDSFGVVTKFPHYQFRPDQEVLLYCELENFVSQPVRGGFETQLQGSYEIVDSSGRRVADQILPEDADVCGNQRQDFYIAYRLHLPAEIEPGDYQFKLTIEDMKGQKFGQALIDFKIIR